MKILFGPTRRLALPALAALLAWQPASAQRVVAVEGTYLHGPAHAAYPERVGKFRRSDIYQYDEDGRDVSASYNLATPKGRLLVTIYIYPAEPAAAAERADRCEEEFGTVKSVISNQHQNAVPIEQGAAPNLPGVASGLGHRALYRFRSPFDDKVQEIRSEVHLYCYVAGDWLVKYRVNAPVAVETRGPVERLIRNGPWPGRSSP